MIIEDGTGTGNSAKIDINNRLYTNSRSESSEEVEADRGNALIVHYVTETKALAVNGLIYILNQDNTADLKITRMYFDPETLTDTDLIIKQSFAPTTVSGQDVSLTANIQKNRGSAETMDLQILVSNSVGGLTFADGEEYHSFPINSRQSTQRFMNGTNILPRNKSVIFSLEREGGGVITAGQKISFSINYKKELH